MKKAWSSWINRAQMDNDLEGYNLLSDYSFSKGAMNFNLPPMPKRLSWVQSVPKTKNNKISILPLKLKEEITETDLFELSEIESRN